MRPRKAEDPESPALRGARFPDAAARPRPAERGSSFRRARWRASVRVSWSVGFVLTSADSWTPYCSASLRFERTFSFHLEISSIVVVLPSCSCSRIFGALAYPRYVCAARSGTGTPGSIWLGVS